MLKPNRCLPALYLLLLATAAEAGELRLDNGAVLPGELVGIDAKKVIWQADKIGKVTVAKSAVVSLQSRTTTSVAIGPDKTTLSTCQVTVQDSLWSLDCAERKLAAVNLTELHSVKPERLSTGIIAVALDVDRGVNPSEELKIDMRARWLRPTHRHNLTLSVDYEQQQGDTTDDESDIDYQYDLLRDDGWYWFGRTRFYRNEFESLNKIYAIGAGGGREYSPLDNLTLRFQAGPAEIYYFFEEQDGRVEPGALISWAAIWQTHWHDIEISHQGDFTGFFKQTDAWRVQSQSGISLPLYKNLVAQLRLDYDYFSVDTDGAGDEGAKWVFALGYKW